ncbi:MAG: hypothetical protein AB7I59_29320 [Geminicoccaceae bacterium]|uniref:hypothetical protein n=1 Tax=Reyranella sp. TaxID=1929291 RepID=UPI003D0F729C
MVERTAGCPVAHDRAADQAIAGERSRGVLGQQPEVLGHAPESRLEARHTRLLCGVDQIVPGHARSRLLADHGVDTA